MADLKGACVKLIVMRHLIKRNKNELTRFLIMDAIYNVDARCRAYIDIVEKSVAYIDLFAYVILFRYSCISNCG